MAKSHVSKWNPEEFRGAMLEWYKTRARVLPWRSVGENVPEPYHVWLSEVMLQQTTVPAVIPYFLKFIERWPRVKDLAAAEDSEVMAAWAGLGYYARARNLLKCARQVSMERGGQFPDSESDLKSLAGIGDYTAAAIRAIAFGQEAVVIDGNIERVTARLFALQTPLPVGKKDIREAAGLLFSGMGTTHSVRDVRAFPQALMDLGATVCTPKSPKCFACPVFSFCRAGHDGDAETYPRRAVKKAVPRRKGYIYWIRNETNTAVLVETRAADRMLGGMTGLPTTDWDKDKDWEKGRVPEHPEFIKSLSLRGITKRGSVIHIFTHFALECDVWEAVVTGDETMVDSGGSFRFIPISSGVSFSSEKFGFPTVFLKAARLISQKPSGGER